MVREKEVEEGSQLGERARYFFYMKLSPIETLAVASQLHGRRERGKKEKVTGKKKKKKWEVES